MDTPTRFWGLLKASHQYWCATILLCIFLELSKLSGTNYGCHRYMKNDLQNHTLQWRAEKRIIQWGFVYVFKCNSF